MNILSIFVDFPAWAMRFPMPFHQTSKCSWGRLGSDLAPQLADPKNHWNIWNIYEHIYIYVYIYIVLNYINIHDNYIVYTYIHNIVYINNYICIINNAQHPLLIQDKEAKSNQHVEWSGGMYPLVNIQKTMERSTIFHGTIHYFDWAIFNSYFDITRGYLTYSLCRLQVEFSFEPLYWPAQKPSHPSCTCPCTELV